MNLGVTGRPLVNPSQHVDCYPFKPLNEFGELYTEHGDWRVTGLWVKKKCAADSDHDGWTNG